ncbi:hypothetical protein GLYMA_08G273150v4 [Glycine max]|nr:hypothetical protein GLYMA_08G273150v4 [Glycine max]KAH1053344.1 hypothetical protein GYH30_022570 [Glycine max]
MPTSDYDGNGNGLTKIEVGDDEEGHPTVKAQTIDELHSLQKKKSAPSTPKGTFPASNSVFTEERNKQQLESISASLASLTRESGPKVVKGDPAARKFEGSRVEHVPHQILTPTIAVSDSALKFTHVLYNLSPAGFLFILLLYIIYFHRL